MAHREWVHRLSSVQGTRLKRLGHPSQRLGHPFQTYATVETGGGIHMSPPVRLLETRLGHRAARAASMFGSVLISGTCSV